MRGRLRRHLERSHELRRLRAHLRDRDGLRPRHLRRAPITWTTNATEHDCAAGGVIGSRFAYACPASGTAGSAWGTDVYTHDSSICTAAVHAGLITLAAGGAVTIEMAPGQSAYPGSTRNGITTLSWGSWSCSYLFPLT
ncbi:MAG: LCCL domain-containing protein [Sandaracinaceae bacterium]|nr:LCCL domain-containing protein [Sandaracinaceae bacterium]